MVPSLRGRPFDSAIVQHKGCEWVAPNAVVLGDIKIGEGSSLWHGVIARGDLAKIEIGKNVVIQDLTILTTELSQPASEAEKSLPKVPDAGIIIKDNVVIGPQCTIGRATLESHSYVADKAVVSDGCTIENYAVLAGGSFLEPNKTVPTGQVWAGNPAKYLRDVTIEEKLALVENSQQLINLSKIYAETTEKSTREVLDDLYWATTESHMDMIDVVAYRLWVKGYPYSQDDIYEIEHRTPTPSVNMFIVEKPSHALHREKEFYEKSWEPLSYDIDKMSSVLKKYGVNTDMYEQAYQRFKHEPKGIEREDDSISDNIPKDQSPWEKKYDNTRRFNPPSIS